MDDNSVCKVSELVRGSVLVKATLVFPYVTVDVTFPTNETSAEGTMSPSELEAALRSDPRSLFSDEVLRAFGEAEGVTQIVV
jgi:hypothetical protein